MTNYLENLDRAELKARAEQMLDYANTAKGCAGRWVDYGVSKAQEFSVFDFAVFKLCLLSLGIWLGACFAKFFKKFRGALFVLFAASWLYLFWRIFFDDED
ncbi:hypothetical protein [Butyricicoccus sp. Marseille-Q5471]|uniref:hypothetical protein n=1 Tax=Butyricicoccus sp. Marseille-Q5471 TaxID=3039493 RepID=UPI0024BD5191|nr:hypothetical protein [Butyricicoccus sp. Marseille-Q5471]